MKKVIEGSPRIEGVVGMVWLYRFASGRMDCKKYFCCVCEGDVIIGYGKTICTRSDFCENK